MNDVILHIVSFLDDLGYRLVCKRLSNLPVNNRIKENVVKTLMLRIQRPDPVRTPFVLSMINQMSLHYQNLPNGYFKYLEVCMSFNDPKLFPFSELMKERGESISRKSSMKERGERINKSSMRNNYLFRLNKFVIILFEFRAFNYLHSLDGFGLQYAVEKMVNSFYSYGKEFHKILEEVGKYVDRNIFSRVLSSNRFIVNDQTDFFSNEWRISLLDFCVGYYSPTHDDIYHLIIKGKKETIEKYMNLGYTGLLTSIFWTEKRESNLLLFWSGSSISMTTECAINNMDTYLELLFKYLYDGERFPSELSFEVFSRYFPRADDTLTERFSNKYREYRNIQQK